MTMDLYTACSIAEGFDGEEHTEAELNEAWQYLIDTGACWTLQGWYGRNAQALIEAGICKPARQEPEGDSEYEQEIINRNN